MKKQVAQNVSGKVAIKLHYRDGRTAFICDLPYYRHIQENEVHLYPDRHTTPRDVVIFDVTRDADLMAEVVAMTNHERLNLFDMPVKSVEFVPASKVVGVKKVSAARNAFLNMFATIASDFKLIPSGSRFDSYRI